MSIYQWVKEILQLLAFAGSLLAGIVFFLLLKDIRSRRNREYESSYWERINRTFQYINRLGTLDTNFANIYYYLEFKKSRGNPPQPLFFMEASPSGWVRTPITVDYADIGIRIYLIEVYRFLKEIEMLLKDEKSNMLVDRKILTEAFSSYRIDLNNFFEAAYMFVSTIKITYGVTGLRGDFTRENLVSINTFLKSRFDFIN